MVIYRNYKGLIKNLERTQSGIKFDFMCQKLSDKFGKTFFELEYKTNKTPYIENNDFMIGDFTYEDDTLELDGHPFIFPNITRDHIVQKLGDVLRKTKNNTGDIQSMLQLIYEGLEDKTSVDEQISEFFCEISYEYVVGGNIEVLNKIELISDENKAKILTWWNEKISMRRVLLFLTEEEISDSRMTYPDLYYLSRTNPFKIPSITFSKCDELCQIFKIKMSEDDDTYGDVVRFIFSKIKNNGWSCVPEKIMKKKFKALDKYEQSKLEEYFIVKDKYGWYLSFTYNVEVEASLIIQKLSKNCVGDFDPKFNKELSECQKSAIKISINNGATIVTGGPGTGKTRCIEETCEILEARGSKFCVTAFTGKAVSRINEKLRERKLKTEARTMDSFIVSGGGIFFDYVIIDECSMLSSELFVKFCRIFTFDSLILFGDTNQLSPINFGSLYEQLIYSNTVKIVKLRKNFRTYVDEDNKIKSGIIENSNRMINEPNFCFKNSSDFTIMEGNFDDLKKLIIKLKSFDISEIVVLTPLNVTREKVNYLFQDTFNSNKHFVLDHRKPPKAWKTNDRIIVNKNKNDTFNGQCGNVIEISKYEVKARFQNKDVNFKFLTHDRSESSIFDIDLGYCLTIDKSQGSEWGIVVLYCEDITMFLNRNRIYTAITRSKFKFICICKSIKDLEDACRRSPPLRHENLGNRIKELLPQLENNIEQLYEDIKKESVGSAEMSNNFEYQSLLDKFESQFDSYEDYYE
jgi:hypothetical protein